MTKSINYTKLIMSLGMIVFVAALVMGATGAFFNDTETSTGNTFTAGALDLKVDSVSHYNGLVCVDIGDGIFQWQADGVTFADNDAVPADNYPQPGMECTGTWEESDLLADSLAYRFFNFSDIKPGDEGENTISLHVIDNDAWGCFYVENVADDDNDCTEPETESSDAECSVVDPGTDLNGNGLGELGSAITFDSWLDEGSIPGFQCNDPEVPASAGASCEADLLEGDNILNGVEVLFWTGETVDQVSEGPFNQSEILAAAYAAHSCTEATGNTGYAGCHGLAEDGRLVGSATYYWGLAWNVPAEVGNEIQTDSLVADMIFTATQHRNNSNFTCPVLDNQEPRTPVGAALASYVAPTDQICDATVSLDESIQTALDSAAADSTVCVADNYSGVGDDVAIRMETTGVTLAALTQGTLLDVPVVLSADGVTVTGFEGTIGQAEGPAEQAAFYFDNDATNATLSYSEVNGGSGAAVLTETGATLGGSVITHNSLMGATQGIYTNPHTGLMTITYNDIGDNAAGIGGLMGATVQYNEFTSTGGSGEAIGIDSSFDSNAATINFNNFLDDSRLNTYTSISSTIDAENNFFGPNGGATQVSEAGGIVDYDPEAGSAFPHS